MVKKTLKTQGHDATYLGAINVTGIHLAAEQFAGSR
jgi:hypothetical protein